MKVHFGENKFEAHDCRNENYACNIAQGFEGKQLPTIDKYGTIKAADRLGDFLFFQLDLFRFLEAFGRDNETFSARCTLGAFAVVFIIEADHRIAIGTVELNRHVFVARFSPLVARVTRDESQVTIF
jgi:hypothetical protein